MKSDCTAGEKALQLLTQLGAKPEKEIFPNSPADDFFNVICRFDNGARVGVMSIFHQGQQKFFFITLSDGMSHQDIYWCLTLGIFSALAFGSALHQAHNSRDIYSVYDKTIIDIRFKLKYVNRHLRKAQRKFHNVEAKYLHALISKSKKGNAQSVAEKDTCELQQKADFCLERFCEVFTLQQELIADLQDAIHANASTAETLQCFESTTQH